MKDKKRSNLILQVIGLFLDFTIIVLLFMRLINDRKVCAKASEDEA